MMTMRQWIWTTVLIPLVRTRRGRVGGSYETASTRMSRTARGFGPPYASRNRRTVLSTITVFWSIVHMCMVSFDSTLYGTLNSVLRSTRNREHSAQGPPA